MKKMAAVLLSLCLALAPLCALGADRPFEPGVEYTAPYRDYGAISTMLHFGCANLLPGESLYNADTITIRNESAGQVGEWMDEGYSFYIYAKWQYRKPFREHFIDALLVMTDPEGSYYATRGQWELGRSGAGAVYSWFFDMNDCLRRCREEHGGALPAGEYGFSLFFNQKCLRVSRARLQ